MSRAFVKESDTESAGDLPERPRSPHPNLVTKAGLAALVHHLAELREQRRRLAAEPDELMHKETTRLIDRDIRYFQARVDSAQAIDAGTQPRDEVAFGALVEVADGNGEKRQFHIVGEDEADVGAGKISWVSPLARALIGARVGESVTWKRPTGDLELEILALSYPGA
jgi:transcription elongation GreA/GreB family factor